MLIVAFTADAVSFFFLFYGIITSRRRYDKAYLYLLLSIAFSAISDVIVGVFG